MLNVRLVVPVDLADSVAEVLAVAPIVNHVVLANVSRRPDGHLVLFDLPTEAANTVFGSLRNLGLAERGSIAIDRIDTMLSRAADEAMAIAPGETSEAVFWEDVKARVGQESHITLLNGSEILNVVSDARSVTVSVKKDGSVGKVAAKEARRR